MDIQSENGRRLLTIREASEVLGVSECTVREMVGHREIPFVRLRSRTIRIKTTDLEKYIDSRTYDSASGV